MISSETVTLFEGEISMSTPLLVLYRFPVKPGLLASICNREKHIDFGRQVEIVGPNDGESIWLKVFVVPKKVPSTVLDYTAVHYAVGSFSAIAVPLVTINGVVVEGIRKSSDAIVLISRIVSWFRPKMRVENFPLSRYAVRVRVM